MNDYATCWPLQHMDPYFSKTILKCVTQSANVLRHVKQFFLKKKNICNFSSSIKISDPASFSIQFNFFFFLILINTAKEVL